MSIIKKIAATFCAAVISFSAFVGCSLSSGSDSDNSDGDSENTQTMISDYTISLDSISDVLGAGWNYGNTLEASSEGHPNETIWGNPQASQLLVDAVADAGFSTVRIPVSYLDYIDDSNGYKVDDTWLERVKEVVDYCYNRDLNVIINVHGDGYNTVTGGWLLVNGEDQDSINEKFSALWSQIAEKFASYDEHLIFESMNEIFNGEYTDPDSEQYANLNRFNQTFVDSVRATGSANSHRWLMVPGWNTNIDYTVGDYGFVLPTDENNTAGENRLILSVHYYDPWDYCGQEDKKVFLWGKRGNEIVNVNKANPKNKADWADESYVEEQFTKLKENFVDKGIPVIIGEFGCIDKALANENIPNQIAENRVYYDGYIAGTAAQMGITPIYWDNGYNGQYGFGLFIRAVGEQSQPEIIDTIVNAVRLKNPKYGIGKEVTSYYATPSDNDNDIPIAESTEENGENPYITSDSLHAYIGLQTEVLTFRNAYDDGAYGFTSEWFGKLVKWMDTNGDNISDMVDTGAVLNDALITEDGLYSVGVTGYNFSSDSGFNTIFVSTDIDYSDYITISEVSVTMDGRTLNIQNPPVYSDASGHVFIEIYNIYNDLAPKFRYTLPSDELAVSFRIEGVSYILD